MKRLIIVLATGLLGSPTIVVSQERSFQPVTDGVLASPAAEDWPSWRRTLDGWGYSPLAQIDRANVASLQLAWSWGMEPGISQTTPLVYRGMMYLANPGGVVHALDAATGDLLWEYRHEVEDRVRPGQQMRSLALHGDRLFLNTADAHVVALDVQTGSVRWEAATAAPGVRRSFTSGPIVAEGVVIVGQTSCGADGAGCFIVGLESETGRELWRTSTIALAGTPEDVSWNGLPPERRAGGDAWMSGSYDPTLGLVYWGTAQAKPWARAARGTGGASELYTNSTLALDPRTGEIRWFYQHLPGESHDMDEAFERILVDQEGRRTALTMGKLGILWEVDRVTGAFIRATDLGYQTLVDVDPSTGRVEYRPGMLSQVGEVIHFCPGTSGLKSLRAMSYDPAASALFVPLQLNCQTSAFNAGVGVSNRVNHFHPTSPDALGELVALSAVSGERLWSRRRRAPYNTSTLATAGGLVFVGDWDRYVLAYDAETGEELWQARLPTMANGGPISYAAGGRQFVAFIAGPSMPASSWATIVPADLLPEIEHSNGGNGVFVFALPATAEIGRR